MVRYNINVYFQNSRLKLGEKQSALHKWISMKIAAFSFLQHFLTPQISYNTLYYLIDMCGTYRV